LTKIGTPQYSKATDKNVSGTQNVVGLNPSTSEEDINKMVGSKYKDIYGSFGDSGSQATSLHYFLKQSGSFGGDDSLISDRIKNLQDGGWFGTGFDRTLLNADNEDGVKKFGLEGQRELRHAFEYLDGKRVEVMTEEKDANGVTVRKTQFLTKSQAQRRLNRASVTKNLKVTVSGMKAQEIDRSSTETARAAFDKAVELYYKHIHGKGGIPTKKEKDAFTKSMGDRYDKDPEAFNKSKMGQWIINNIYDYTKED